MGAEIWGLDLSKIDDTNIFQIIKKTFFANHLLVIKEQTLSPDQLLSFSKTFGELDIHVKDEFHHKNHPEILVLSNKLDSKKKPVGFEDAGRYWHTDMSYTKIPPMASILYALEIPTQGGDTLFCNMQNAYDNLTQAQKSYFENLKGIHSYEASFTGLTSANKYRTQLTEKQKNSLNEVEHPIIRTHNFSNQKSIYANPGFTKKIKGLDIEKSNKILSEIFEHSLNEKNIFVHRWNKNDLVMWDNSNLLHHATKYNKNEIRHMLRTTIKGTVPK